MNSTSSRHIQFCRILSTWAKRSVSSTWNPNDFKTISVSFSDSVLLVCFANHAPCPVLYAPNYYHPTIFFCVALGFNLSCFGKLDVNSSLQTLSMINWYKRFCQSFCYEVYNIVISLLKDPDRESIALEHRMSKRNLLLSDLEKKLFM